MSENDVMWEALEETGYFNIIEVIAWMPQEIFLQIFKCTQAEIKIHISMASRVPALPVDEGWEEAYFTPV